VKQIINIKTKLHKFKNNKTKTCLHKLINKSVPNPKIESQSKMRIQNAIEDKAISEFI